MGIGIGKVKYQLAPHIRCLLGNASAIPHIGWASGERISHPSHWLGFWRTHQPSLTLAGLLENQSTMDFKVKSMLLGYVNLKISK